MRKKWRRLIGIQANIVCPYCLQPIKPGDSSIDHEPPKSRNQELGPSKLIQCCKKCNQEKGALTAAEYAEWKRLEFIRTGRFRQK